MQGELQNKFASFTDLVTAQINHQGLEKGGAKRPRNTVGSQEHLRFSAQPRCADLCGGRPQAVTRTGAVVEEIHQVLKRSLAGFVPKVVKFRQLLKAIILTITLMMVRVTANQLRKYQAAG